MPPAFELVNAWLKNSNDPIDGNSRKCEQYWNNIAEEFNSNLPRDGRRTAAQCKSHWKKMNNKIVLFNGCWWRMKGTYVSGQSDDQLMKKAHAAYKVATQREGKQGQVFTLDYWWKQVKDQPKWGRIYDKSDLNINKRLKLNDSGAYTSSSNQESEEASPIHVRRPEG